MRAISELGPDTHRMGAFAIFQITFSEWAEYSLGLVRAKLIKKGMIYSPAYGYLAFKVPLFDEFMLRAMPELKK